MGRCGNGLVKLSGLWQRAGKFGSIKNRKGMRMGGRVDLGWAGLNVPFGFVPYYKLRRFICCGPIGAICVHMQRHYSHMTPV